MFHYPFTDYLYAYPPPPSSEVIFIIPLLAPCRFSCATCGSSLINLILILVPMAGTVDCLSFSRPVLLHALSSIHQLYVIDVPYLYVSVQMTLAQLTNLKLVKHIIFLNLQCRKKHTYVCPKYEETGICPQGSKCKLHHPKKRSKGIKRKSSRGQKNAHGRYFGSRSVDAIGSRTAVSEKLHIKNSDDIFNVEDKFTDYISLDISDEEAGETVDPTMEQITMCASDGQVADLDDEQIKPVCVMHRLPTADPSPIIDSLG